MQKCCGTCKAFRQSGEFDPGVYIEDALTAEVAEGYVLCCQGYVADFVGREVGGIYDFDDDDGKRKPWSFFIHRNVANALEKTTAAA
jgi:hypothetical protein